ncbi:MAG: cobalamin-dependent protein, partial [Nanoarchaeota archaeon]|nr:cobalamin-dependent protein [Nanoarchaeota archaeon]
MRKIKKIQLIFPPSSLNGVGFEGCFVPNGLLSIANYLSQTQPEIEVEVIDGTVTSLTSIISKLDADLVGIGALTGNYKTGKQILKAAKQKDILTVVGNHHGSYLFTECQNIEIPDVDFIIDNGRYQRGEFSFNRLVKALKSGSDFDSIPSLAYKKNGVFVKTVGENVKHRLKDLVKPELLFIKNFEPYFEKYNKTFWLHHEDYKKSININFIKGCLQGMIKPCDYCCLKDHKIDMLSPEKYWEEVVNLVEKGFNYIFETCNSLSSLKHFGKGSSKGTFLDRLADAFPKELNGKVQMQVYGSASEIDDRVIENFKKMCVQRVIFGFDDYDPRVVGKTSGCIGQNIEVAKKLDKAGIQIFACYVPGSEGETKYKLNKTVDQIMEVMELPSTSVIEFTSLAPMPGSRAYEQIKYRYWELYGKTDCLDVVDLARVWVQE